MSYIDEINGFERWLETNYLPSGSQLLWYKLIALFNRAGWPEWVQVDNQRLMSMMQIKREATFISTRDKLIEAGLFEFQRGKKGYPNKYKRISLSDTFTFKNEVESVVNTVVNSEVESVANTVAQTVDIIRLRQDEDQEKDKTITTSGLSLPEPENMPKVIKALEQEFGMLISPSVYAMATNWLNDWPDAMMPLHAIEQAALANKRNARYVNGILRNWKTSGISTVDQAKAQSAEFVKSKQIKSGGKQLRNAHTGAGGPRDFSHLEE